MKSGRVDGTLLDFLWSLTFSDEGWRYRALMSVRAESSVKRSNASFTTDTKSGESCFSRMHSCPWWWQLVDVVLPHVRHF